MAVVGDVFGLNSVYEKQLENVENTNHASWPEDGHYGYYAGGHNWTPPTPPYYIYEVDRIDFATETRTKSTNLPGNTGLGYGSGISGNTYGYIMCGLTPTVAICQVKRIDFSSETYSLPGNDCPTNLDDMGLLSDTNINRGYIVGGYTPGSSRTNEIKSFDTSSESFAVVSAALPQGMNQLSENVHNENYGYFVGGYGVAYITSMYRLEISSETITEFNGVVSPTRTNTAGELHQNNMVIFLEV